jgi:hypothetical protein
LALRATISWTSAGTAAAAIVWNQLILAISARRGNRWAEVLPVDVQRSGFVNVRPQGPAVGAALLI